MLMMLEYSFAHPEEENEGVNLKKKKMEKQHAKEERCRKGFYLAHPGVEAGCGHGKNIPIFFSKMPLKIIVKRMEQHKFDL